MRHVGRPRTLDQLKNDAYRMFDEWGPKRAIDRDQRLAEEFPMIGVELRAKWMEEFRAVDKTIWSLAEIFHSLTPAAFADRMQQTHEWMDDKALARAQGRWQYYAIHEGYDGGARVARLSNATWERIHAVFPRELHSDVVRLLESECGPNLQGLAGADPVELERYRFAALKLSEGTLERLHKAIELAKTDWRDLLAAAGFARSTTAHERWHPKGTTQARAKS